MTISPVRCMVLAFMVEKFEETEEQRTGRNKQTVKPINFFDIEVGTFIVGWLVDLGLTAL